MNNHYKNVMARYERGEVKTSLHKRGFMFSYGDDCKRKLVKPDCPQPLPKYEERNYGDEPDCPPPSYAPPLPKYLPNGEKLR